MGVYFLFIVNNGKITQRNILNIKFSNIENLLEMFQGDKNITIDNLRLIEPLGIALLKLHAIANTQCQITVSGHGTSNLASLLSGASDTAREYTPLAQFNHSTNNMEEIVNNVTDVIISNTTNLDKYQQNDLALYLKYLISEMMDNVVSHSCSTHGGFIAAQYFKARNKVQVVIVDNGIGLMQSLSSHYSLSTEEEAILKAMEKEVTGSNAFDPYNQVQKHAGLGLFFLSKILQYTKGRHIIISNDTVYRSSDESFKIVDTSFKGTMIAFELYEEELEYEFPQLFGIIRDEDSEMEDEDDVF